MTTPDAAADARFIAQLRAACGTVDVTELLRQLYWDGSALGTPWFDALAEALAGYDHVRCVTMLTEHKPGPILSVVTLLAFLARQPAPAEWVHYNLTHELGTLLRDGVQAARMPMAMHAFVATELFPGNDYVLSLPHGLLSQGLAHWMPREAVRHGLMSLRMGNGQALHDLRPALRRLGLEPAGAMDRAAAEAVAAGIGSAASLQAPATASRDTGAVRNVPVVLPAAVLHPRPEGDGHYYQFKRAGAPIPLEPVFIHQVAGATLSCDVTRLGQTEIYCYANGTCLTDLCLGASPFVADDVLHLDKPLMLVDDVFSGVVNISHFLLDQVPRLLAYRRLHPGPATLLQCDTSPYYQGALAALGIADVLTPPNRRFSIRTPTLFAMSNIVTRWDHPLHSGAPRTAGLVRDAFGVGGVTGKGRRLYISRADAGSRRAVNAPEVEAVFARHGFETVTLSGLSFDQQRSLFGEASHVAGVHGAGLTNLLFAPADCRVMEILPPLTASHTYWMLCSAIGQPYRAFLAEDLERPTPDYADWPHDATYNNRDVRVDAARLDQALRAFV